MTQQNTTQGSDMLDHAVQSPFLHVCASYFRNVDCTCVDAWHHVFMRVPCLPLPNPSTPALSPPTTHVSSQLITHVIPSPLICPTAPAYSPTPFWALTSLPRPSASYLCVIQEAWWYQWPQCPVNQPRHQQLPLTAHTLTPVGPQRQPTHRRKTLTVINLGQQQQTGGV